MMEEEEAIRELKFLMVGPSPPDLGDPINILRKRSWLTLTFKTWIVGLPWWRSG